MIGYKYTFNRVDINVSRVAAKFKSMHFVKFAFHFLKWEETFIRMLERFKLAKYNIYNF